ncbi:putative quinol monooxygenase [Nonlabens xiamenensis]|uniref:putative quinol monooxygenase n=1 Tax=Nonlabens xiamenensis TaxID=2341043 RepID=UPI000F60FD36|nr:antibiotic biosynthesis monooxygenase [Nonlabens xiamenensis]
MIVRIVHMHFNAHDIDAFKLLFKEHKEAIRNQPGCTFLELYQDTIDKQRFFTYSHWSNESALNNYRHSALFAKVWPATKVLFDQQPKAYSVNKIHSLA